MRNATTESSIFEIRCWCVSPDRHRAAWGGRGGLIFGGLAHPPDKAAATKKASAMATALVAIKGDIIALRLMAAPQLVVEIRWLVESRPEAS